MKRKKQSTMQITSQGTKKIWKTIKPCFSDKPKISERIFLIQNDEMVLEDGKHLFLNVVTSLNIPKIKHCNPLSERILQPTLRAIFKHANHSSICVIKKYNNPSLIILFHSTKRRYN